MLSTGARSLPVVVGTLPAALAVAAAGARLLGLPSDLRTLIGVGSAICGASAIAAADSVIDADESDVSYAVATIFTFNIVAVLLYFTLGHAIGLSQRSFGLWAGTAVDDLSSVVAASTVYGHTAASYGVTVKLTRTLAIVPVCLWLSGYHGRIRISAELPARSGVVGRVVPPFIAVFVVAVAASTAGLISPEWHRILSRLATWMITAALAAIGLSTDTAHLRRAGGRPLLLGALLWFTVGVTSLGMQAVTGNL